MKPSHTHALNYVSNIRNMGDVYAYEPILQNLKTDRLIEHYKWWVGKGPNTTDEAKLFNSKLVEIALPKIEMLLERHPDNKLLLKYQAELKGIPPERKYNDVQAYEILLMAQSNEVIMAEEPIYAKTFDYQTVIELLYEKWAKELPKFNVIWDMFDRPDKRKGQWFSATNSVGYMVADLPKYPELSLESVLKICHEFGHMIAWDDELFDKPDLEELPAVKMEYWFVNQLPDEADKKQANKYLDYQYQNYLRGGITDLKMGKGSDLYYRYALAHTLVRQYLGI